eukprot:UC4_evm1s166
MPSFKIIKLVQTINNSVDIDLSDPKNEKVVEAIKAALDALGDAALEDASIAIEACDIQVLPSILSHIKNPNSASVVQDALWALQALSVPPQNRKFFLEHDGIKGIIAAMSSASNSSIQYAANILRRLVIDHEPAKDRVIECKGLDVLVFTLESGTVHAKSDAASTLKSIAVGSQNRKNKIIACGAIPALLTQISQGQSVCVVAAAGALQSLAYGDDAEDIIVEAGAIPTLLEALKAGKKDKKVLTVLTAALRNLVSYTDTITQNEDSHQGVLKRCQKIIECDGISTMIETTKSCNFAKVHENVMAIIGIASSVPEMDALDESCTEYLKMCKNSDYPLVRDTAIEALALLQSAARKNSVPGPSSINIENSKEEFVIVPPSPKPMENVYHASCKRESNVECQSSEEMKSIQNDSITENSILKRQDEVENGNIKSDTQEDSTSCPMDTDAVQVQEPQQTSNSQDSSKTASSSPMTIKRRGTLRSSIKKGAKALARTLSRKKKDSTIAKMLRKKESIVAGQSPHKTVLELKEPNDASSPGLPPPLPVMSPPKDLMIAPPSILSPESVDADTYIQSIVRVRRKPSRSKENKSRERFQNKTEQRRNRRKEREEKRKQLLSESSKQEEQRRAALALALNNTIEA